MKTSSILPLVLVLLLLAGGIFYTKPLWDEVSFLEAGLSEQMTERKQFADQLVSLQKIQQDLNNSTEVSRETTLASVPEKLDQDELIRELAIIASDNDIVLNGVNFGIPQNTAPGEIATVTVGANLTGNQSRLVSFLKDIEGSTRKLLVNSISVQTGTGDLGIARVNFNLSMEAYYQGTI